MFLFVQKLGFVVVLILLLPWLSYVLPLSLTALIFVHPNEKIATEIVTE